MQGRDAGRRQGLRDGLALRRLWRHRRAVGGGGLTVRRLRQQPIAVRSARMTAFGSHGRARTDEFAAGDVGYVPQGYGHYIENTGKDEVQVVLVLNNATYESISITAWLVANPDLLLATNFGVPESVFASMPNRALIIPKRG